MSSMDSKSDDSLTLRLRCSVCKEDNIQFVVDEDDDTLRIVIEEYCDTAAVVLDADDREQLLEFLLSPSYSVVTVAEGIGDLEVSEETSGSFRDAADALDDVDCWADTPEGFEFWNKIHLRLVEIATRTDPEHKTEEPTLEVEGEMMTLSEARKFIDRLEADEKKEAA